MKHVFIAIALCLALPGSHALVQDSFRAAAMDAIHMAAPAVAAQQVQLLAIPKVNSALRAVHVVNARFDPALRGWKLELRCDPAAACIPAMAFIESDDQLLVRAKIASSRKKIAVRSGDRKQLMIQTDAVRLSVPVVCLQSGAVGDQIRLREWKGTRVFLATVQPDSSLLLRRAQ